MKYIIDTDALTITRVEEKAPAPAPAADSVYLPKTGHTLPLVPDDPEMSFWGYMVQNAAAVGGLSGQVGPYAASLAFSRFAATKGMTVDALVSDRTLWPEALDRYFNEAAYQTPEEIAAAAAAKAKSDAAWDAAWAAKLEREREKAAPPSPPDDTTTV